MPLRTLPNYGLQQRPDGKWVCPFCNMRPLPKPAIHNCRASGTRPRLVPASGPGDYFHRMLKKWLNQDIRAGCKCKGMIRKMNGWGWAGCRAHIDEIVDKMLDEGRKRNMMLAKVPGARVAAKAAVSAILLAKRDSKPDKMHNTILLVTVRPHWQDAVRRSSTALESAGLSFNVREVAKPTSEKLKELLDAGPRLVVFHAFGVKGRAAADLAAQYPHIQFVSSFHSAQNHGLTFPSCYAEQRAVLEATKRHENFWYAAPDPWMIWNEIGYERFVWWPNPVYLPPPEPTPAVDPPTVLVSARPDVSKALPTTIQAATLLQRSNGVRVVLSIRDGHRSRRGGVDASAASCGLDYEMWPQVDPDVFYAMLRRVSLLLHPSLCESFGYAPLDAASVGRPFVGSPTIRYTPPEWTVRNPNDPHEIADVARHILDNYQAEQAKARPLAERVAAEQNAAYAATIRRILGETP